MNTQRIVTTVLSLILLGLFTPQAEAGEWQKLQSKSDTSPVCAKQICFDPQIRIEQPMAQRSRHFFDWLQQRQVGGVGLDLLGNSATSERGLGVTVGADGAIYLGLAITPPASFWYNGHLPSDPGDGPNFLFKIDWRF